MIKLSQKDLINLKVFLKENQLTFKTDKQAISWVKRHLKPKTLLKLGPNYLVNKNEISELFEYYLKRQEQIQREKVKRVKKLRERKKFKSILN